MSYDPPYYFSQLQQWLENDKELVEKDSDFSDEWKDGHSTAIEQTLDYIDELRERHEES